MTIFFLRPFLLLFALLVDLLQGARAGDLSVRLLLANLGTTGPGERPAG
jgi:hypothetical protein